MPKFHVVTWILVEAKDEVGAVRKVEDLLEDHGVHNCDCLEAKPVDDDLGLEQMEATSWCARCGNALKADGLCTDDTCLFNALPQSDLRGWEGHPSPPEKVIKEIRRLMDGLGRRT